MATTEHKSDFELTKDTPYLALTGELWGVWSRYNDTALYVALSGNS